MATKKECDRCGVQDNDYGGGCLPDKWRSLQIGNDSYPNIRDLCQLCVESFWKWMAEGKRKQ